MAVGRPSEDLMVSCVTNTFSEWPLCCAEMAVMIETQRGANARLQHAFLTEHVLFKIINSISFTELTLNCQKLQNCIV